MLQDRKSPREKAPREAATSEKPPREKVPREAAANGKPPREKVPRAAPTNAKPAREKLLRAAPANGKPPREKLLRAAAANGKPPREKPSRAAPTNGKSAAQGTERRKGEIKKEKILWTAAKQFSEHGYSATTLTTIAEAAETYAGSLYYHFKSRDDITRAVLNMSMTTISDRVREVFKGLGPEVTPLQKLEIGIKTHLGVILSGDPYLPAYNRIVNEVPREMRTEIVKHAREYGHMFHEILVQAQELGEIRSDLDAKLIRMLLFGTVTWTQVWFKSDGRRTLDEVAQHVCEIFLSGIRTGRVGASNGAAMDVATENSRLRKAVLDLSLERLALQERLR